MVRTGEARCALRRSLAPYEPASTRKQKPLIKQFGRKLACMIPWVGQHSKWQPNTGVSFIDGASPSQLFAMSDLMRQGLDLEEFLTAQHSIVPSDPLPQQLFQTQLEWHPHECRDEWVINPGSPCWQQFDRELGWVLRRTASAIPIPPPAASAGQVPISLDLAQLAVCLWFTKTQWRKGQPLKDWLVVPSKKWWQMRESGQDRDWSTHVRIRDGWSLDPYDLYCAACCPASMDDIMEARCPRSHFPKQIQRLRFRYHMELVQCVVHYKNALQDRALQLQGEPLVFGPPKKRTLMQRLHHHIFAVH